MLVRPSLLRTNHNALPTLIIATLRSNSTLAAKSSTMPTVSDVVKDDHRELESYYDNMLGCTDVDTKARWQNQFTWELARHSVGEELVIYPAMEKYVPNGKAMTDKDRAEHQKAKEQLEKFQALSPASEDFEPTLRSLMADLKEHIKGEEEDDLPALERHLPEGETGTLAANFERTKMFVPTRSHPSAPDQPPFETVVGLLAAPLDKLGDVFRKFPQT